QSVAEFGGRLGRTTTADVLAGSKRKRITELNLDQADHYGALRLHTQERALKWIDELIAQRLLKTTAEEHPRLMITESGVEALNGETPLALSGFYRQSFACRVEPEPAPTDLLPSLDPTGDWRLQIEIWRQGGAEPDRKTLLGLLRDARESERDDLITVIGAL